MMSSGIRETSMRDATFNLGLRIPRYRTLRNSVWTERSPMRQFQRSPKTEVTHPKNGSQTSAIGDKPQDSPLTEVRQPREETPTSTIGDTRTTRRKQKLDGSRGPNLRHRRPITRRAEDGGYRPQNMVPNLRHRQHIRDSPMTEVRRLQKESQTSTIGDTTHPAPKTEVRRPVMRKRPKTLPNDLVFRLQ